MTASRQWRERTLYLYWRGVGGEYSPPKITVIRGCWARGLRPRAQFATIEGRKGFREGRNSSRAGEFPSVFPLSFLCCFPLSPSFDSDPGPWTPRPLPPAGGKFLAGGIFAGDAKGRREQLWVEGKIFGTVRRNLSGS